MSDSLLQNLFQRPSTSITSLDRVPIGGASYSENSISGATQANPVVLTITGHPFNNGDLIYVTGVGGMTQLNGNTYTVAGKTANTVQLTSGGSNVNGTGYSAYTAGGTAILGRLQYGRLTDLVGAIAYTQAQVDALLALKALQTDIDALSRTICTGRLTTESNVGASSSDRTAQSTLYFTTWNGNLVGLHDGAKWNLHNFTQRSLAISGLTSGKNYDVFLYNNSGTLTLELSSAWTNDTTRADALTLQDGVYVKSGAITRRWLGTIRTTATNTIEDSSSKRYVWNKYNQVPRYLTVLDITNHTYTTLSTTRQYRNQASNQIDFVLGEAQSGIPVNTYFSASQGASEFGVVSFGVDTTTSEYRVYLNVATGDYYHGHPEAITLGLGRHYLALVQRSLTASPDYVAASLSATIAA